jgi:uncharacterized protein YggL (DUF469 family)
MHNVGSILAWSVPNAVWIGIVIYLVTHPEVAAKWGAILNSLFSRISRRAEMRSVALDIQGRIDGFSKSVTTEVPGVMPAGVKIEWVAGELTKETFFKDGKIILRMNYHSNQDENFVRAAIEYISGGMLSDSRPHVDEQVMKSADLISTKKLIEKERKTALPLYYSEVLSPERKSNDELDRFVVIMQKLDERGYFTQIFLRELQHLGVTMQFSIPEESVKEETKQFVEFLDEKINKKKPGVNVDPTFFGDKIKTSIVYVAKRAATEPQMSIERHLNWIEHCVKKEIETIYLCAKGYNIPLVKEMAERLKLHPRLTKVFENEFKSLSLRGEGVNTICVRYDICDANAET